MADKKTITLTFKVGQCPDIPDEIEAHCLDLLQERPVARRRSGGHRRMTEFPPELLFLTGSRVYGWPKEGSDLDVVVQAGILDEALLKQVCNSHKDWGPTRSFRFGNLNLIVADDPEKWYLAMSRCCLEAATTDHNRISKTRVCEIHREEGATDVPTSDSSGTL